MREMAKHGGIEDNSVIDYVICGIPDITSDKNILYGAVTIDEFKTKIELYERIKERSRIDSGVAGGGIRRKTMSAVGGVPVDASAARCFNCGDKGHQSRGCPDIGKGPKCFSCRSYGHKSFECSAKSWDSSNETAVVYQVNHSNDGDRIVKSVLVSGCETLALVDTGCDINLCRRAFLSRLNGIDSIPSHIRLIGPAGANFYT